jgi:hypothetical protein
MHLLLSFDFSLERMSDSFTRSTLVFPPNRHRSSVWNCWMLKAGEEMSPTLWVQDTISIHFRHFRHHFQYFHEDW